MSKINKVAMSQYKMMSSDMVMPQYAMRITWNNSNISISLARCSNIKNQSNLAPKDGYVLV